MAGRKKGLSADEKRKKMLELFYESKEFFQLKELEKIAPKQKGVISQSVKEITQLLVDEGLVECEKIGTFVCYWAFPTKAVQNRKRRLEETIAQITDLEEKLIEADDIIKKAKQGKEDSEERGRMKAELAASREVEEELRKKLKSLEKFDPEVMAQLTKSIDKERDDANRWTDNIFAVRKWCKKKFGMDLKVLDKQFEIPEDLDYIE